MNTAQTILVVEDEPLVGEEIKEELERLGYRVPEVVACGEDVAPALAETRPDLVLMDINLGGGTDGISAATHARSVFDIPVIYLTAYSDKATLERAAATEPAAYLLKPFDERELAANVRMALTREALRKERERAAEKAAPAENAERSLLESGARQANKALLALLPPAGIALPDLGSAGFLSPCPSGSGDLYDLYPIGPGRWGFYSLDVMGHGSLPALFAYALHDVVRYAAGAGITGLPGGDPAVVAPADVVARLNEKYAASDDTYFFTIACGDYDARTGAFRLARAGHPPVLHLKAKGGVEVLRSKGTAVGAFPDIETEELSGTLEPGDRLGLFSDGALEALGRDNPKQAIARLAERFEAGRLMPLVPAVASLQREFGALLAESGFLDDLSGLVLERPAN